MPTTTTTTVDKAAVARWNVAVWNNAVWVNAVKNAEAAGLGRGPGSNAPARSSRVPPAVSVPTDIASVMACIRSHESGNYSEHSHLQDGSGAYQMVPGTFRHYEAAAGFSGYAYAYEAPPAVQDAVVVYALTHGGAGNWSDRFGNDPCTSSLPGGG